MTNLMEHDATEHLLIALSVLSNASTDTDEVLGLGIPINEETMRARHAYNEMLDNVIRQITALKMDERSDKMSLRDCMVDLSRVSSKSNRCMVDRQFDVLYRAFVKDAIKGAQEKESCKS